MTARLPAGSTAATDDTFNNNSPNTWTFTGISDFEGGFDVFNNNSTGRVVNALDATSAETAQYISLESHVNSGEISLVDQMVGEAFVRDRAYTDGDYIGNGGTISVDVDLSQAIAGLGPLHHWRQCQRRQRLGNDLVSVNRIDQARAASTLWEFRSSRFPATCRDRHFELANGPIDTGFFTYDLYFTNDTSPYTDGDAPGLENLANTNLGENATKQSPSTTCGCWPAR